MAITFRNNYQFLEILLHFVNLLFLFLLYPLILNISHFQDKRLAKTNTMSKPYEPPPDYVSFLLFFTLFHPVGQGYNGRCTRKATRCVIIW